MGRRLEKHASLKLNEATGVHFAPYEHRVASPGDVVLTALNARVASFIWRATQVQLRPWWGCPYGSDITAELSGTWCSRHKGRYPNRELPGGITTVYL